MVTILATGTEDILRTVNKEPALALILMGLPLIDAPFTVVALPLCFYYFSVGL